MNANLNVLDSTIEKTNLILIGIERDLGWEGRRDQSYHLLRAVLHAIRDRLRPAEAANFSAQLPLFLKGVFFDEYKPENVPIKFDRQEFIQYILCQAPYDTTAGPEEMVRVALRNLFNSMGSAEAIKLSSYFPADLADFIFDSIS